MKMMKMVVKLKVPWLELTWVTGRALAAQVRTLFNSHDYRLFTFLCFCLTTSNFFVSNVQQELHKYDSVYIALKFHHHICND